MDYKLKYLKYKNKYNLLKKQIGGNNINFNRCDHRDITSFINGENIKIEENPTIGNKEMNFEFNKNGDKYAFTSKEVTEKNEPLLVIHYYFKDVDLQGKLNFIRTAGNKYTFDQLIDIFFCLSKYVKAKILILDDDARFFKDKESYDAKLFRAFQGKKSLYDKFGFEPSYELESCYSKEDYENDINYLSNITFGQLKNFYEKVFTETFYKDEDETLLFNEDKNKNEKLNMKFGEYIKQISDSGRDHSYKYINTLLTTLSRKDNDKTFYTFILNTQISLIHHIYRRIINTTNVMRNTDYKCKVCK